MTDHRINLTVYNLANIIEGKLDEFLKRLEEADRKLKLENKNSHSQISELREKIENNTHKNNEAISGEIERLKSENNALREKHQVISSRLRKVLAKVKSLTDGVES